MKITASKDFGNKKILLPLTFESTEVTKEEDLTQVELFSNPNDANSTKVCFAFKILEGTDESPREVIQWCRNVEHAFVGLNQMDNGFLQHKMVQQFSRTTALGGYNTGVQPLCTTAKASDIKEAEA